MQSLDISNKKNNGIPNKGGTVILFIKQIMVSALNDIIPSEHCITSQCLKFD